MINILDDPNIHSVLAAGMRERELSKLKFLFNRWKETAGESDEEKMVVWVLRGWDKDAGAMIELGTKAQKVLDKWHMQTYGRPIRLDKPG